MRTTTSSFFTFLTLISLTLTTAAPVRAHDTLLRRSSLTPSEIEEISAPLHHYPALNPVEANDLNHKVKTGEVKTYGTYLHVIEAAVGSSEGLLDLGAVEAAKDAVMASMPEWTGDETVRERVTKFRGGLGRLGKGSKAPRGIIPAFD